MHTVMVYLHWQRHSIVQYAFYIVNHLELILRSGSYFAAATISLLDNHCEATRINEVLQRDIVLGRSYNHHPAVPVLIAHTSLFV